MAAERTPSAEWREKGYADPHGTRYDCERAALAMGNLTDDELANGVFLHGDGTHGRAPIEEVVAGRAFWPIAWLTAAKDRIRWLSRALERERGMAAEYQAWIDFFHKGDGDYNDFLRKRLPSESACGVTATGPVEVPASEEIMALVQKFGEQCMDCGAWPGARAPGGQELRWRQGDASVTFEKIAKALRAPLARQGTPALPPEVRQAIAKGHCICAPRGLRADPDCPQHGVGVTGTLNDQQEQPR